MNVRGIINKINTKQRCEYLTLNRAVMSDIGKHGVQQFVDKFFPRRLSH